MRHDRAVSRLLCERDCRKCFAQRSDLIHLHQDRVGATMVNAFLQELRIGDEQIIANQLHLRTKTLGEFLPTTPIVFSKSIFNRVDRKFRAPTRPQIDDLIARGNIVRPRLEEAISRLSNRLRFIREFAHRWIKREEHLLAKRVTRFLHRGRDQFKRFLVVLQIGREASFITNRGRQMLVMQHPSQRVIALNAAAQRLFETEEAPRLNHELLEINSVVGMLATVDDVEHRHGKRLRSNSTEVAIQRLIRCSSSSVRDRHRHSERRIRTKPRLVFSAIKRKQYRVKPLLISCITPTDRRGNLLVHMIHGSAHTFAKPARRIAIAQLHRFMLAS